MNSELPGYRITRQIGVGARSKISLATELRSGKTFAVTYVERESGEDDPFVGQVETEFEVSSKMSHSCLRHSFHIHRERKMMQTRRIWLVMEYVDGLNLEKARPNRLKTFLSLFRKVAQGLSAMHVAGFVHTDIKPTNIMITRGAAVKIIDFGQSCPIHHRKERIQGTPDYIAPEQVRRLTLDQRTDVFNLGATMYWVLTSEKYPTAIRGTDARGGINIITADKPIAPIELNDKIPLSLSKLIMECCRDNPHERPGDMKQVVSRLEVVQRIWAKQREAHRADRMGDALSEDSNEGGAIEE
ncbi:MAG: serine/threonine protein kinase [Planctomycetes bacterium]|nr:serine/threonine protein kinase [Planctomycetota bacterium]